MLTFTGGQNVSIEIPLLNSRDEPLVPDSGTAKYTVYNHSGTPIVSDQSIATDTTTTSVTVSVAGSSNTIASDKSFERRMVVVTIENNGNTHQFRRDYRLIPLLLHSETPESVRSFLGVEKAELPDEDIDLASAYFSVEKAFGSVSLTGILESGDYKEMAANEAIRMTAALNVLPSLKQRLAQNQSDGLFEFSRPELKSFDQLKYEAGERYQRAMLLALETDLDNSPMVLVTQDADPITSGG